MGVSIITRQQNKEYAIVIVYANKTDKILDFTPVSNIRCYTWSLKKRLTDTKEDYAPTNKALRFVKPKFNTMDNVKVVKLDTFYGNYNEAKNKLNEISHKVNIPSVYNLDTFGDDELNEIKNVLNESVAESEIPVDTNTLNKTIEKADKNDDDENKTAHGEFYCELTNKYFLTKSSLNKHIKKSKAYEKALLNQKTLN